MAKLSLNTRITSWFLVSAVLLLLNALFVFLSFQRFEDQKNWVVHTYEVITNLEAIIANLVDVQSSQRGYIITGNLDYLAPYTLALPKIEDHLARLDALITDNPAQMEKLEFVKAEVKLRLTIAADVISTYQTKGQVAAFAIVKSGAGKREMDQIRSTVQEMIYQESRLLDVRQARVDAASSLTLLIGAFGVGICLFILAIVFWLIRVEGGKRNRVERDLNISLRETERISNENRKLSDMSDYLQGCQTIDEASAVITRNLPDLLPGTSGAIALFNNSRNLVETLQSWGTPPAMETQFISNQCWGLRRGKTHHLVPNGPEPICTHLKTIPDGGSVCFPMQAHGETLGLFYVCSDNPANMDDARLDLIRRVGEQLSLAISNLKLQAKLRDQSLRDPLTGLFNRRYLEETLERELSRAQRTGQPLSVLVLDIDHFKRYNDTMGHDAGDALLSQFARQIQQMIRREDIACRYGGEEFVVVLPMTALDLAQQCAQDICNATRAMKVHVKSQTVGAVTVSVGVATFPLHAATTKDLISAADAALYVAKESGRDQVKIAELLIQTSPKRA